MVEASVLVVGAGAIGGVTSAKMTGEVGRVAVLERPNVSGASSGVAGSRSKGASH